MLTVTKGLRDELGLSDTIADKDVKAEAVKAVKAGKLAKNRLAELCSDKAAHLNRIAPDNGNPSPDQVFGTDGGSVGDPRVKHVKERFSNTKSAATWESDKYRFSGKEKDKPQFAKDYERGMPAFYWETIPGMERVAPTPQMPTAQKRFFDNPSQYEYAKMGALYKAAIIRDCGADNAQRLVGIRMSEEDEMLVKSALHDDEWVGPGAEAGTEIRYARKLKEHERITFQKSGLYGGKKFEAGWGTKAPILDDGTSGGQQAVPQYFDFEAIRIPLLYGELVPFVEITPTDRGVAAHSYSIGTPTYVTTASGSAITAYDATNFVTTYDVNFYPASCGILWGRDFEMDAAPNFGQMVVAQLGNSFKNLMDKWIAVGDGTTQPQGLVNASGTVSVTATGASHATMVYNDGLNLMFGVTKPYRKAFGGENTMFIATEKMYKKFMQLTTGVTGDTRPIYGMHLKDFQLGDYHFAVENDIADGTVFACNLRGYRLYRRLGLYFELLTTGQTLTLANEKLLFARARFGGKLTLGGYCSVMTSLQIG